MEAIIEYVKPELLVLVPVLYFIGMGLKKAEWFKSNYIPLFLGIIGMTLSAMWVAGTSTVSGNWQNAMLMAFTAVVQGILCAGLSVYANQIWKQTKGDEVNNDEA